MMLEGRVTRTTCTKEYIAYRSANWYDGSLEKVDAECDC